MKPDLFLQDLVDPALKKLAVWTGVALDDRARVLVMAIAGQESNWADRRQIGGPARSYWQFELGGGVAGVFRVLGPKLKVACDALDVPYEQRSVFEAMAWNDTLACCLARLLLWSDARPLPDFGARDVAWNYYLDNWRPGMPHPAVWPARYATAMALISVQPKEKVQ